jgi:hypothetical protein
MTDLPPPDRTIVPSVGGVLHPVTAGSARARALNARSRDAQEAKRATMRAGVDDAARHLQRVIAAHDRQQLGPAAAATASDIIARVGRGEIKIRHAADAAELLKVLTDIARLEAGEPTSAALVAHVGAADVARQVAELQAEARRTLAIVAPAQPEPDDTPA